jgi:hypothetical protein
MRCIAELKLMRPPDPTVFADLPALPLPSIHPNPGQKALKSYPQSYPQAVV